MAASTISSRQGPHRPLHIGLALLAAAASIGACAKSAPETIVQPTTAACAAAVDTARQDPRSARIHLAQPDTLFLPPMPAPSNFYGQHAKVTFWLNARGRTDSLTIRGLTPSTDPYISKFRSRLEATQFTPATLNGCDVPSVYEMEYKL